MSTISRSIELYGASIDYQYTTGAMTITGAWIESWRCFHAVHQGNYADGDEVTEWAQDSDEALVACWNDLLQHCIQEMQTRREEASRAGIRMKADNNKVIASESLVDEIRTAHDAAMKTL